MDHHAYLLLGEEEALTKYLKDLFAANGVAEGGNPDLRRFSNEVFAVDDARDLTVQARSKAFGERKIFILSPGRFTPEAQNALLKTLEEPIPNTHFFILAREASNFLPTVISRLQVVRVEGEAVKSKEVEKFLGLSPAKRLDFAKKFADKNERSALSPFLDALLAELKIKKSPITILKKVLTVREFASDPSSSPRLILEHLALIV